MKSRNIDYNRRRLTFSLLTGVALVFMFSCAEFVDIGPPKTEIISSELFSSDASTVSAIRGIYSMMMADQAFTNGEIERYTGLSSDELLDHSGRDEQLEFYTSALSVDNGVVKTNFWEPAYKYISNANAILEGISKSTLLSEGVRKQVEGEAKFIRAFCYFYLTNLFGDVPYITSTDFRANSVASRTPVEDVYRNIIQDLNDARELLKDDFSESNDHRTQPNRGAASAFLARIYLYQQDWAKAELMASELIGNTSLYALEADLDNAFLADNTEAIWQLEPVTPEKSTAQARLFILQYDPIEVSLQETFVNSFESNDLRRDKWIGTFMGMDKDYFYPYKYKVYTGDGIATEYSTVLRLAEVYLIRAEAATKQGKIAEAIADLDSIRSRAGLPLVADINPGIVESDLLLAIEAERRHELFTEWGHRWLDLKRTDRATAVLSPNKISWQDTDVLYPIPQSERLINTKLTQNFGY